MDRIQASQDGSQRRKRLLMPALMLVLPAAILAVALTGSRLLSDNTGVAEAVTATQDVSMFEFGYSPATFSSPAGESLTVNVTNTGSAPHTFTITGVADTGTIPGGGSGSVTFTPTQAGTLQFFCTIHGASAMSGTITVTAAQTPASPTAPAASPTASSGSPAPSSPTAPAASPTAAPSQMQPPRTGDAGLAGQ